MMEPDDTTIILMLMDRDEDGVRHLLARHGPQVKGSLMKKLGNVFDEDDLMEILHEAARRVWNNADKFDDGKGSLGAWYCQIAINYARDLLRGRAKASEQERQVTDTLKREFPTVRRDGIRTRVEPASSPLLMREGPSVADPPRHEVVALGDAIKKLPPTQRAIIEADLFALDQNGRVASSEALAKLLNLANGSIPVLRNRAHEALKKALSGIVTPKKGTTRP